MATFTDFSEFLPSPSHPVTTAGDVSASGVAGPGFASLNFSSVTDTQVSRTVSGRGVQRDGGSQHWEFTISYNPIFRYQFDVVDAFLLARNPRRDPFYVILPTLANPKNPVFADYARANGILTVAAQAPGVSSMMLYAPSALAAFPQPGDAFNVVDANDFNHQKLYKVTRVETNAYYQAGTTAPSTSQMRVHFSPPLQRDVSANAPIRFINPRFRVIAKSDVQEHQLNTDNLYSFTLPVEEIQP